MSLFVILLCVALVIAQLSLPMRFAFVPLIVAASHIGNVEVLPELTPARIVILVGLSRAFASGHLSFSMRVPSDALCVAFAIIAVTSSIGHEADEWFPSPLAARVGLTLNVVGSYLYGRAYLTSLADIRNYAAALAIVLMPLALGVAAEKATGRNAYSKLGAKSEVAMARLDKIRANGPFRHPILAGTAGAAALPFAFLLLYQRRWLLGALAFAVCITIVISSSSSGPLAAVGVSFGLLLLWPYRRYCKALLWCGLVAALFYYITRGRGPWYLMASLDLVGGSTGWHRARLIDQGLKYLPDWWLWGTDYTRHWMSSGVRWNPNHVDLTNYYLHLGVTGGAGLTLCLFGFLITSFRRLLVVSSDLNGEDENLDRFTTWIMGSALAAHAVSFISISYFDQMYVFFYMLIGAIACLPENQQKANDDSLSLSEIEKNEGMRVAPD